MPDSVGTSRHAWRPDAGLALVLVMAATILGASYTGIARRSPGFPTVPDLNVRIAGAAMLRACGRGDATPVAVEAAGDAAAWTAFLSGQRERLDCSEVPASIATGSRDAMQRRSQYLLSLIAAVWSVAGLSWVAIDWMLGTMFGVAIGLAYLVCRLAMPRAVAVVIATLVMISPLHLAHISDFRDYSKVPFFFATLLFAGLLVSKPRSSRMVMVMAAAAGAVIGVGLGMRTDIALNLGVLVVAIAGFLPGPLRTTWKLRMVAAALCVASFGLMAWPILRANDDSGGSGSLVWHWALLGLGRDFDRSLGVEAGPYELGDSYSDSYVATVVDAFARRTSGRTSQTALASKAYEDASRAYYLELATTFPADLALRGWAALIKIVALPYADPAVAQPGSQPAWLERLMIGRGRALAPLAPLAGPILIGVLTALWITAPRHSVLIAGLVVFAGLYPSIQFQARHIFHLEFISLWVLGLAVSGAWALAAARATAQTPMAIGVRALIRPAVFLAAVLALTMVPLAGLRAYQSRTATGLLSEYANADVVAIAPSDVALADSRIELARGDAMFERPRGQFSSTAEMLVFQVVGRSCPVERVALSIRYQDFEGAEEFSRTIMVSVPAGDRAARVFVPVYEAGATNSYPQRLAVRSIEVPAADRSCISEFGRLASPGRFPLLLQTTLHDGWQNTVLHQTLAAWETPVEDRTMSYWAPHALRSVARRLMTSPAIPVALDPAGLDYRASMVSVGGAQAVEINGRAAEPGSYLVAWKPRAFDLEEVVVAEGVLATGGVTIGLTNASGWVARADVDASGPFRAFLQAPAPGDYQLVIANHLGRRALNRVSFSRLVVTRAN